MPEAFAGHPTECTCYGRPPPKMTFSDAAHCNSGVLRAFQHDEATDPELDLAETLPSIALPESRSTSCLFLDLPPELLELILDYLVPTDQTYHFFPARSGKQSVQIVQKFVPEKLNGSAGIFLLNDQKVLRCRSETAAPNSLQSIQASSPKNPSTGSAYTSLAGTCKHFQDIIYTRLFSHNAFIFHLTAQTIHSAIWSSDFTKFRSWTRTTQDQPVALGPLTARAAKYLKHVTLIASLPFSHGSQDIKALSALFGDAAGMLSEAKLSHLAVALNLAKPGSSDNRFSLQALPVELLLVEVDGEGSLSLSLREDPKVESVRESNKTQRALAPLLQGPKGVKEVVLRGPLSDGFVQELESALKGI